MARCHKVETLVLDWSSAGVGPGTPLQRARHSWIRAKVSRSTTAGSAWTSDIVWALPSSLWADDGRCNKAKALKA